jgi:hypothetical protein
LVGSDLLHSIDHGFQEQWVVLGCQIAAREFLVAVLVQRKDAVDYDVACVKVNIKI